LKKQFADVPEAVVSGYAKKNTKEFYAEMYAEYILTKGQTKNPLVLAMAKEFNWNKPNVSASGPALGVVESDAIKPVNVDSESSSIKRNAEIEDEVKEIRAYLPKDADDDRLIDALAGRGSRGEIDNTDIYWPMIKKYQAQGLSKTDAENQVAGIMLRTRFYLENKQEVERVAQELRGYIADGYAEDAVNYRKN
jgi:hypothetical protein